MVRRRTPPLKCPFAGKCSKVSIPLLVFELCKRQTRFLMGAFRWFHVLVRVLTSINLKNINIQIFNGFQLSLRSKGGYISWRNYSCLKGPVRFLGVRNGLSQTQRDATRPPLSSLG